MADFKQIFKPLLIIERARDMAQILQSFSCKVCSALLPKFVATESPVLILDKYTIFNQCLAAVR